MMKNKSILFMTQAAMIATLYVILTVVFQAFSFGQIQVRIAEALVILPLFTPAAVPGLFVGCLIGNIIGGAALWDIFFGSLATLIGAVGTRLLKNQSPVLATLPPILSNALIIPLILRYTYGVNLPVYIMMATVGGGEILSCGVLGMILYASLKQHRHKIFSS